MVDMDFVCRPRNSLLSWEKRRTYLSEKKEEVKLCMKFPGHSGMTKVDPGGGLVSYHFLGVNICKST